ncbi:MAG TPA: alanine racemase [Chloroflexota bacterium]|nr:alanine racemase [Chloroflexota bacterium]
MQRVADLDTPVMVVDLDVLEGNIRRLQEELNALGLSSRPHIKTHKIPSIGHMQVGAGAAGITCQKLGEAEVFADAGFTDILVPYNIVGAPKLERLTRLARRVTLTVAVDSEVTARGIAEACQEAGTTANLLVEVDSGGHRAGVQNAKEAQALARAIGDFPGVTFQGFMCYPSRPPMGELFDEARDLLTRDGIPVNVISGGGTGAQQVSKDTGCTEHRSGTYIYNDLSVLRSGHCTLEQCAMSVLVTVVSTSCPGYSTVDGGSKTFTNDALRRDGSNGHVREYPDIYLQRMNEEHGVLSLANLPQGAARPAVGEKVHIIPNHACGTTNLHDVVYGYRRRGGEEVVEVEWPVPARGKIR